MFFFFVDGGNPVTRAKTCWIWALLLLFFLTEVAIYIKTNQDTKNKF